MKFAVVTTSLNPGEYLTETLQSVLAQAGDFSIAYHVQDAGSTDGTIELLQSQLQEIANGNMAIECRGVSFSYASMPDQGMYDGINRGFRALKRYGEADLMFWINADDRLAHHALAGIVEYFKFHPTVDWLTGRTMQINECGETIANHLPPNYRNQDLAAGRCDGVSLPFVTQEATIWRSRLWERCGALDARLNYAGDYEYWRRAARLGFQLVSADISLGYHRKRQGQLSAIGCYRDEVKLLQMDNA